jgi:uncharacterized protein
VDRVLIVGSSARATAASARRAGFEPFTIDQFADSDTRQLADAQRVSDYPQGIPAAAAKLPDMPWIYTGSLENQPELIQQLAKQRPLWGNDADALLATRSPLQLQRDFAFVDFQFAESTLQPPAGFGSKQWLLKPLSSGGGRGIRFAESDECTAPKGYYFQKHYPGQSYSALYFSHREHVEFLGVTEQLIGPQPYFDITGPAFGYRGNRAPLDLACNSELFKIGLWLNQYAKLSGVWGIDFGLSQGRPVLYEINPRYTAAVETLEAAYGFNVFDLYRSAFLKGEAVARPVVPVCDVVKLIVFAASDFVFPDSGPWQQPPSDWPCFADVPNPGDFCPAGFPVLTLFYRGTYGQATEWIQSTVKLLKQTIPIT